MYEDAKELVKEEQKVAQPVSYLVQDGRIRMPYDVIRVDGKFTEDSYVKKEFPPKCCEGNVYLRKKQDVDPAEKLINDTA